jgi:hypothetical protein
MKVQKDIKTISSSHTISHSASRPASRSASLSVKSQKAKLQDVPTDFTIIASMGQKALRVHVATIDAFPSANAKNEVAWSCIVDSIGDSQVLKEHLEELKGDESAKEQVITYVSFWSSLALLSNFFCLDQVWSACAQLRGELITKARQKVVSSYSISTAMGSKHLSDLIMWLIKTGAFIHDNIDLKVESDHLSFNN